MAIRMMGVAKENYRTSLLLATLFHVGLFLALFFSLRHTTKLLFLASRPLQVIHATAIDVNSFSQITTPPTEQEKIKPSPASAQVSKPVLITKSPVVLPVKANGFAKLLTHKVYPIKTVPQKPPLVKKIVSSKNKVTQPAKKLLKKEKIHPTKVSAKSLQIVQKNVKQLLEQEMTTLNKASINAARNAATTDKYRHLILQSIAQQWIIPPELNKHLETKLAVHLAPGGMVLEVLIVKSSGNPVLDRSAQTAVYKASPLPVPKNSGLFNNFRQINLTVRPEGVITQ
ncbi:MAG: cell envelope integrity protein TolA [Candidatus Aquirickettsiella gammari]